MLVCKSPTMSSLLYACRQPALPSAVELIRDMALGTRKPREADALEAWDDMLGVLKTWPATADGSTYPQCVGGLEWRYLKPFKTLQDATVLPVRTFQAINDRQVTHLSRSR